MFKKKKKKSFPGKDTNMQMPWGSVLGTSDQVPGVKWTRGKIEKWGIKGVIWGRDYYFEDTGSYLSQVMWSDLYQNFHSIALLLCTE